MTPRSPNLSGPEKPGPLRGNCPDGLPVTESLRSGPSGWTISFVKVPHDLTIGAQPP